MVDNTLQPEVGIQQEVVKSESMPQWVQAAMADNIHSDCETSYLRYQEKEPEIPIHRFERYVANAEGFDYNPDIEYDLAEYRRITPWSEKTHLNMLEKGYKRARSTCLYCMYPWTNNYNGNYPWRCKPCNRRNSFIDRGKRAGKKLHAIMSAMDWKPTMWTFTEKVRKQNHPFSEQEIMKDKTRMMEICYNMFRSQAWYPDRQWQAITVYEAVVRAPGDEIKDRSSGEVIRTATNFELHGHIHMAVVHGKDSYADWHSIKENYFEGPHYLDKFEPDYRSGKERTPLKIIEDYLIGYIKKDTFGKYGWAGNRQIRKIRRSKKYGSKNRSSWKFYDQDGEQILP